MSEPVSVLFVCLGNICRSTMAEGVFQHMVKQPKYQGLISHIDSCGTGGYHQGDKPDKRTRNTLKKNGITGYKHAARQILSSDLNKFDYVFAMDYSNLEGVRRIQNRLRNSKAQVMLFGEWTEDDEAEIVDDPWYGGDSGFDTVYEQCVRFSTNFLEHLRGHDSGSVEKTDSEGTERTDSEGTERTDSEGTERTDSEGVEKPGSETEENSTDGSDNVELGAEAKTAMDGGSDNAELGTEAKTAINDGSKAVGQEAKKDDGNSD